MISLIVGTLGTRPKELVRLLESIQGAHTPVETLIVVQSGTVEKEKLPGRNVRCITTDVQGLSRARNVGLREARGSICAFPDDDCWYAEDVLDRAWETFRDSTIDGVVGRLYDPVTRNEVNRARWPRRSVLYTRRKVLTGSSVTMFFRRSLLQDSLLFDERFGAGARFGAAEETELLLRIVESRKKIVYVPDLVVFHSSLPLQMTPERAYGYGMGFGALARKELPEGNVAVLAEVARKAIAAALKTCFYSIWNKEKGRYFLRHLKGLVRGFNSFRKER